MSRKKQSVIIISISSDIGTAMAKRWLKRGWDVYGTYRTKCRSVDELLDCGVILFECDLSNLRSVDHTCLELNELSLNWDILVLATGTQEPIGLFTDCDFDEWANSIQVNFTNQLRIVKRLIPARNMDNTLGPCVLFFAGGGTNAATANYSAYTISKIALIKMCELLDAEIPDVRFIIVGPGWVKTKIHQATLEAGERAGDNYEKTNFLLNNDESTPMKYVLDCCDWLINSPREVVSGRNFSTVFDKWDTKELSEKLMSDSDMYKLRRYGNEFLIK